MHKKRKKHHSRGHVGVNLLEREARIDLATRPADGLGVAFLGASETVTGSRYLVDDGDTQVVVDSGLYGVVRHPMYTASVLLFLSMPLVLNSIFSFLVMLAYLPIIARRIRGEEKLLKKELPGYEEYMERVKYRLIPFIW